MAKSTPLPWGGSIVLSTGSQDLRWAESMVLSWYTLIHLRDPWSKIQPNFAFQPASRKVQPSDQGKKVWTWLKVVVWEVEGEGKRQGLSRGHLVPLWICWQRADVQLLDTAVSCTGSWILFAAGIVFCSKVVLLVVYITMDGGGGRQHTIIFLEGMCLASLVFASSY